MSIEAVNQFLTKVSEDRQLQAEIDRVIETENVRQAVTELGAKRGYEFTPEELASQFQNYQNQLSTQAASDQLSEEELEAVAGGATPLIGAVAGTVSAVVGTVGAAGSVAGAAGGW